MDIPDIDLVVVYGAPSNILQLYQVRLINFRHENLIVTLLQLFGRAGRAGSVARAHIFFNTTQKNMDPVVKAFCVEGENCRRKKILMSVGSSESSSTQSLL